MTPIDLGITVAAVIILVSGLISTPIRMGRSSIRRERNIDKRRKVRAIRTTPIATTVIITARIPEAVRGESPLHKVANKLSLPQDLIIALQKEGVDYVDLGSGSDWIAVDIIDRPLGVRELDPWPDSRLDRLGQLLLRLEQIALQSSALPDKTGLPDLKQQQPRRFRKLRERVGRHGQR